jgi:hypothetical protein
MYKYHTGIAILSNDLGLNLLFSPRLFSGTRYYEARWFDCVKDSGAPRLKLRTADHLPGQTVPIFQIYLLKCLELILASIQCPRHDMVYMFACCTT